MSTTKRKLLLIACSNRKVRTKGLLPALERYDGVTYRVIRKAMREGYFPSNVDIKILSAKYGLIDAKTKIPYYNQQMERARAMELRPLVLRDVEKVFQNRKYSEVFVNMGKVYRLAVNGFDNVLPASVRTRIAEGGIGTKAAATKEWLRQQ